MHAAKLTTNPKRYQTISYRPHTLFWSTSTFIKRHPRVVTIVHEKHLRLALLIHAKHVTAETLTQ